MGNDVGSGSPSASFTCLPDVVATADHVARANNPETHPVADEIEAAIRDRYTIDDLVAAEGDVVATAQVRGGHVTETMVGSDVAIHVIEDPDESVEITFDAPAD